jgi:hypothetical protein
LLLASWRSSIRSENSSLSVGRAAAVLTPTSTRHGGQRSKTCPCDADTRLFEMRGRELQGWLRVEAEGLRTKRQLDPWVRRGVAYARSLPPKR